MRLHAPRRVIVNDHEAYLWPLLIDHVPYQAVWWPSDGSIRVSWPADEQNWSPFIKLGRRWSPRYDLRSAQISVRSWAARQEARLAQQ